MAPLLAFLLFSTLCLETTARRGALRTSRSPSLQRIAEEEEEQNIVREQIAFETARLKRRHEGRLSLATVAASSAREPAAAGNASWDGAGKAGPAKGLPVCSFSKGAPALAPWDVPITWRFDAFLRDLGQAGLVALLDAGTLLGSYRHHGTIPHDEDMDVIFDLCLNRPVFADSPSFRGKSCAELQKMLQAQGTEQVAAALWKEVLGPRLARQAPRHSQGRAPDGQTVKFVQTTSFGMRLSNGDGSWSGGLKEGTGLGVGMDVNLVAESADDYCRCPFGSAEPAYCETDSKARLIELYGKNFMIPKSQCDYYKDIGHANWSFRSKEECKWAEEAAKKERR